MKKLVCMILALCLCLSFTAALAGVEDINKTDAVWPVSNGEKIKVTIGVVPQMSGEYDVSVMWMPALWDEMTNLDIEWQVIENSSASEKIPLMLAGGTMPDAILGWYSFNQARIVQYGVDEGMLYPIDELLEYMPWFSKLLEEDPAKKAAVTAPDGHIYGLPNLSDGSTNTWQCRYFINSSWLENLGLAMPETLDDFYNVLKAFKEQDANGNGDATDELPLTFAWEDGYQIRGFIQNALGFCTTGGASEKALLYKEDGTAEATFIAATEEYKEYLAFMNKLWTEGLIDPEVFTQDMNQVNAKVTEGRAGVVSSAGIKATDPTREWDYTNLGVLTSDRNSVKRYAAANIVANAGMFVINADCDETTAAALAKFADSFFNPYCYAMYKYGPTYSETETLASEYGELFSNEIGQYWDEENQVGVYVFDDKVYASNWEWRCKQMGFWAYPGYSCNGNDEWNAMYAEKFPTTMTGKNIAAKNAGTAAAADKMFIDADVQWIPYFTPTLPGFYYSTEDLAVVNELSVLLSDYVEANEAKFVTGEKNLEADFEAFQNDLKTYGVDQYIELLQKYWEAYNANK